MNISLSLHFRVHPDQRLRRPVHFKRIQELKLYAARDLRAVGGDVYLVNSRKQVLCRVGSVKPNGQLQLSQTFLQYRVAQAAIVSNIGM